MAGVSSPVTCIEILDKPTWGEAMSGVGLCAEILPPIKAISEEDQEKKVTDAESVEKIDEEEMEPKQVEKKYEEAKEPEYGRS